LNFSLRTGILCFLLSLVCRPALGSSIFLRTTSATLPQLAPIQTNAGNVDPSITSLKLSLSVTALVLTDTLSADQFDGVKSELLGLYTSLHGHSLRVAIIRNGSLGVTGPFSTRGRLKSALDEIAFPTVASAPLITASGLDVLNSSIEQLGADGSHVILIGELPNLDQLTMNYASALLSRSFESHHIQLSWYAPANGSDIWISLFQSTGGTIVQDTLRNFSSFLENPSQSIYEVDWLPVTPSDGFVVSHAILSDQDDHLLIDVPDINAPASASLPTIELYADIQNKAAEATGLLAQRPMTDASARQIREDLQKVLDVNPRDLGTLVTGAAFYEEFKDYTTAAKLRSFILEVRPLDGDAHAALGHDFVLSGDFEKAETTLLRVLELNAVTPQVNEDLARIHLARKDDKGAILYLNDVLRADAKRQDLWFLQAEAANRLRDSPLAVQSFEQGLDLGGFHLPESSSLLRLYLATKQDSKAVELTQKVTAALPPDADLRAEFARTLDELKQNKEALSTWRRALEVKPNFGHAHYRIAQILLESGDAGAAEAAADAGLLLVPKSADLYIVKADAQQKQGATYSARSTLEQGAAAVTDPALLLRLAAAEDTFGGSAADAYARLAKSFGSTSPEQVQALKRGITVALRDGDLDHARFFSNLLNSAGQAEFQNLLDQPAQADTSSVVPGGLDALAFAARLQEHVSPDRFFVQFCQRVIDIVSPTSAPDKKLFIDEIQEHFERIAALEVFGKHDGNRLVITLSPSGKNARRDSEKVLSLLGIKLRSKQGTVELNLGEKKEQAKKQDTVSALAIDTVGMEEAFRSGKPYILEIPYDRVSIYPSEKLWSDTFYAKDNSPGGFATALLRMPKMASLYIAISFLDRRTISELLSAVSLRTLYDHYSDLMYLFSPAFSLQNNRASVPGGPTAEPIWAKLAGASPQQPGPFFRALLDRDGGKLLAFYFTLSQLDARHQAFFAAHYSRTEQFYKLFASSKEMERGVSGVTSDSTFREILRSVPLDKQGRINFPGSAEVWMVAKGRTSNEAQTTKLLKRVSKAVAPEVEDEVLVRLAGTQSSEHGARTSELDNFLAVSRIDVHRKQPLDEESALILAQHYSDSSSLYAYFTDLTDLGATDFRQFFLAVDRIKSHPPFEANIEIGQLHALIEWICLLNRRHVIGDSDAAQYFRQICDRFASANGEAAYTAASLDSARSLLLHCLPDEKAAVLDVKIRACLLGSMMNASRQEVDYNRVLDQQKVPSLDIMICIYDEVAKWSAKTPGPSDVAAIEKTLAGIQSIGLPKESKVRGREKDSMARYDTSPILKLIREVSLQISKRKVNRAEIEKLSKEMLAELEPQVTLALVGPIYGYFLRSTDLIEAADSLLLRKHHYLNISEGAKQDTNLESEFHKDNEGVGSYFRGGFAEFPLAVGAAAEVGWRNGGGPGAGESVVAEIAAIRATNWEQLQESDQRLLSLRILVAREWIVESASHPELLDALSQETLGLLSPARRADLLTGIESRNWPKVWASAVLPDLFSLGGKYLDHFKTDRWISPVATSLRSIAATNDGSRLQVLGSFAYHTLGCGHPHLFTDAPYEEYERQLLPYEIAERSAEFKLYLSFVADSAGVPPSSLANVAETLAAKAFRDAKMNSPSDWRSLLAAYATVTPDDLRKALQQ
jgi:tetratricopeptide (TPR) repeat protein